MSRFLLFFIIFLPYLGYTQSVQFTKESIPIVDGKIVFNADFEYDLSKEEYRKRARSYLNDVLNPYSGQFQSDNDDYMLCRITDYIELDASIFQVLGMYMSYNLKLDYQAGACRLTIENIKYMEKAYFEAKERSQRDLNVPEYSGKDIMIDKKYTLMLKKKASELLTDASLKRINELIANLGAAFAKE